MKRVLVVVLAALLVFGLVGCQSISEKIGEEVGEEIAGGIVGGDDRVRSAANADAANALVRRGIMRAPA